MMKNALRTLLLLLLLCIALPATAEGVHFSLQADVDPVQFPQEQRSLMQGVSALLDVSRCEGTLVYGNGRFDLNAAVALQHGGSEAVTTFRLYGLDTHWGLTSSLLGETELIINGSALLPFGMKARDHLGIPLDKAALLAPCTHTSSLASALELVEPLFPTENGTTLISPDDLDALAAELLRLCEEDAALSRWLEATGLQETAVRFGKVYERLSGFLTNGLTIERTDSSLLWRAGFFQLLNLQEQAENTILSFGIPGFCTVNTTLRDDTTILTGSLHLELDGMQADVSFALPTVLPVTLPFYLSVDAKGGPLPDGGLRLLLEGEPQTADAAVVLRLLEPETNHAMATLTATLTPYATSSLPQWQPEDLLGVNILSVNSESLRTLLSEVRTPLLTSAFNLLVAAPPESVQALMDLLEATGVLGLLTDSLSGGFSY